MQEERGTAAMKTSRTAEITPYLTEITHTRCTAPGGYYAVTIYPILPGILLAFNEVHTTTVPTAESHFFDDCLIMNYCLDGRCEFCVSDDNYGYVDSGMSSIAARMAQGDFYYPAGFYAGYEIYIFPPLFTAETERTLRFFELDLRALRSRYQRSSAYTTPRAMQQIWDELYSSEGRLTLGTVRLQVLRALQYLDTHTLPPQNPTQYLTRTQSLLAKKLEEELTQDLSRHLAVREVAERYGVSETSLKNYFRAVYGANVSTYLSDARMKLAAQLLADTTQSIAAIARQCGYVNQGRFAGVFYGHYHVKPMDYRRASRLTRE